MNKLNDLSPTTLLLIAGIIGFLIVSKLFDFFKKDSAWETGEKPSDNTPTQHLPPQQTLDPQKRQQQEYKHFLQNEKKRQHPDP